MKTGLIFKLSATVALLLSALCGLPAQAQQTLSASQDRKARLEEEIRILDAQLKDNQKQSSSALASLTLVRSKISARKELIAESDREISGINTDIRRKQRKIDSLQVRLDTMTFYYNRLVKNAYKNRDARIWYMYILGSDNIAQGLRRYSFLKNLSREMNVQAENILDAKSLMEAQKDTLEQLRTKARALREERVSEMKKLQDEEKSSQQLVNTLQKNRTKYQKQLASDRKEVEALNKEIARLIAESMKTDNKKSSGTANKNIEVDYTLGKEFASNKGKLPWPAQGPVVETFGVHYHPVFKQLKLPNCDGISIAVSNGTEVQCVFDGVVKNVIVMQGYNRCVLVQHGEWFTFYCKLGTVSVKAGDKVKTGQVLGKVEPIGGVSQLHFQIWSSKGPQDPQPWLRPR